MIVLVCGSRSRSTENDKSLLFKTLDSIPDIVEIVHGGCEGPDRFCNDYKNCDNKEIECKIFLPDWSKYGRAAGPIRNKDMVEYILSRSDRDDIICIALWDKISKGTKNTIDLCVKNSIKVVFL